MAITRRDPRNELHAAFGHVYRACLALPVAWLLFHYQSDVEQIFDAVQMTRTWQGLPFLPVAAGVAATIGIGFTVAAIRRLGNWLTARKHLRMLEDPQSAALVPPLPAHFSRLEPSADRAAWNSVGSLVLSAALLAGVALLQFHPDSNWDADAFDRGLAWAVTIVVFLGSVYGVADRLRRWRLWRHAERLSRDRARASSEQEQRRARAAAIPPLEVVFPVPDRMNVRNLVHVATERNVFGGKPWNIVYLRLFANEAGLHALLKGAWRECGYVHFIRDVDSVREEELGPIDNASLFINSRSRMLADLDRRPAPLPRGTREFRHLAANDLEVEDEYGSYPVYAPLCHESFWKVAIDIFLDRADVVLLDLSGFHWENMGTGYELQRVIDRFPIERTVLLADSTHTDRPFLQAQIQRAWSQMAAGSPNAGNEPRKVMVAEASDSSRAVAASLQERLSAKQTGATD